MRRSLYYQCFAFSVLIAGTLTSTARSDLSNWTAATANWNVGANWSNGFVPGTTDFFPPAIGIIDNAGTATINSAVPAVNQVWVGNNAGKGLLNVMPGGSLTATNAGDGSGIIVVGRTVDGLGANTGSRFNVSGGSVVTDGMEVGQDFNGQASTDAQMTISGSGAVTVKNFLRVGNGSSAATGGGVGILTVRDSGTFTDDGSGTLPFVNDFIAFGFNGGQNGVANGLGGNTGTLNLQDNAIFTSKRPMRFGWVEEGHGNLNVSGNAQLIIDSGELSPAPFNFGDFNNSAVGTGNNRPVGVGNQSGGTITVGTDAARPRWTTIGGSGRGEYHLSGGKLNIYVRDGLNIGDTDQNNHPGEGLVDMTGGTLNATEITVGKIGRATGVFNQSGGTVNIGIVTPDGNFVDRIDTTGEEVSLDDFYDGRLVIGAGLLGGDFTSGSPTATGTYTLSAGTLHVRAMTVAYQGTGTFTQTGGTVIADAGVIVGQGANAAAVPSTGIVNLNGGEFQTLQLRGFAGGSTVNFNGATLRALANNTAFITFLKTANIQAGGLLIDSNGFSVTSASNTILGGVGGVTKQGAGTLTLAGADTYGGTTSIQAGTLLVTGSHTGGGAYTVNTGATLGGSGTIGAAVTVNGAVAPGTSVGTLTVNGNVTFGGSGIFDVEVNAATHTADKLVVNGNLNLSGLTDMLRLTLVGGALPEAGPLTIATYSGTLTGTFDLKNANFTINYGTLTNSSITISNITSIGGVLGDYNNDGTVNAADYTVYRNRKAGIGGTTLPNDATPGSVAFEDYTYWKIHYGASGSGSGLASSVVPEPTAAWLLVCGLAICGISTSAARSRRGRQAPAGGL